MKRRLFLGCTLLAQLGSARAQTWPDRPLRFIVPRAAGGSIDIAGRLIADAISSELRHPIVIEARPGANGTIGSGLVARAAPDGTVWLLATVNHLVAPILQPAPFDPVADFRGIALLGTFTSIAVVRASLPVFNMAEFIAHARAHPGTLNYLNSGNGSTMHLATELLQIRNGIKLISIQYKGMQQGIGDLINDRLDFAFTVPALALPHIRTGRLRALATVAAGRLEELPDVPTLDELGLKDIQLDSWFALLAPAATPDSIVLRMAGAADRALQQGALREQLRANSLEPSKPLSPAELDMKLSTEFRNLSRLTREAGIKISD